jgi:hypothetical protein
MKHYRNFVAVLLLSSMGAGSCQEKTEGQIRPAAETIIGTWKVSTGTGEDGTVTFKTDKSGYSDSSVFEGMEAGAKAPAFTWNIMPDGRQVEIIYNNTETQEPVVVLFDIEQSKTRRLVLAYLGVQVALSKV